MRGAGWSAAQGRRGTKGNGRLDGGCEGEGEGRGPLGFTVEEVGWTERLSIPVPRVYYCTLTGGTLLELNYCKLYYLLENKKEELQWAISAPPIGRCTTYPPR